MLESIQLSTLAALRSGLVILAVVTLGGCATEPEDLSCTVSDDCSDARECLQGVCVAAELPRVRILSPEDGQPYTFGTGDHEELVRITATGLTLGAQADSSQAVIGEGYLEVFVDEVLAATVDSGDLVAGVDVPITIADQPGAHRLRVQAKLHDGTSYDNPEGRARHMVWVDDGEWHVALRRPWPGDRFGLEAQTVEAEVVAFGGAEIGPPSSGQLHGKVFYDESFPSCFEDPACSYSYVGVVPSDDSELGPVYMPEAGAGPVTLTTVLSNPDHTLFEVDGVEGAYVWSQIEIQREDLAAR